jgi:hypothetical protein
MQWPSKRTEYIYFKVDPRILAHNSKFNIFLTSVSQSQLTRFTGVPYVLQRYQVHICSARFEMGLVSQGNRKFICDLVSTERQRNIARRYRFLIRITLKIGSWKPCAVKGNKTTNIAEKSYCPLMNPMAHYRVQSRPSLVPILSQINPIYNLTNKRQFQQCAAEIAVSIASYTTKKSGFELRQEHFYPPGRPDKISGSSSLVPNGYRGFSPRLKRPGRETDRYLPSRARAMNVWRHPDKFMRLHGVVVN